MTEQEAKGIIEALIFTTDKPISLKEMKEVLEDVDVQDIRKAIDRLQEEYESQTRSFRIVEVAGGFRMSTRPQFGSWLKKFHKFRHRERLSKPSLETLAIVAYKQPITRAEIESIRGVDVSGILHNLLEKRLVRVMGRKEVIGHPLLYGTTDYFLEHFGLKALSELPRIEELKNEEDLKKIFNTSESEPVNNNEKDNEDEPKGITAEDKQD